MTLTQDLMSLTEKNHLGERTFHTFAAWKRAAKAINAEVWFEGDADIAQAMVGPKPYKKGETHSIGEWDGAEGVIYNRTKNEDVELEESGSVAHFARLLGQFTDLSDKEHDAYMDRNKKKMKDYSDKMKAVEKEINKHYGNLKNSEGEALKKAGISRYTIDDPVEFAKEWLGESENVVVPAEYKSSGSKAAYKLGFIHGFKKVRPIDAAKSFGVYADAYTKGHSAGENAGEGEAWHEKQAARASRQHYHEDSNGEDTLKKDPLSLPKLDAFIAGVYESEELKKVAKDRRTSDKLEIGDVVEITGNVNFKEQTGEITRFGKDKKFVVVKLYNGGEHSFHSSDVSEADLSHEQEERDEAADNDKSKFYIAFYDSAEERSWIGVVTKEHGGKWHEKTFKGKPEMRWGQTYMSYLTPDDIMNWIHKDYHRGIEIEGPFYDAKEAEDHVKQNWGRIDEAVKNKDAWNKGWEDGYHKHGHRNPFEAKSHDHEQYEIGHQTGREDYNREKFQDVGEGVGKSMSKAAHAADVDQSDREYIAQRQERARQKKFDKGRDKYEKSVGTDPKTTDYPIRIKEAKKTMSPMDILDKIAQEKHGEEGFMTLDSDYAAKYVDLHRADKIADKEEGEFGLLTCDTSAVHRIINKNPDLLIGLAKKALKNPSVLDELDEAVFTNYADWKDAVILSNPAQAKSIRFRGKMEGEKTTIIASIPGDERVFGIWDDAIEHGKVLSESEGAVKRECWKKVDELEKKNPNVRVSWNIVNDSAVIYVGNKKVWSKPLNEGDVVHGRFVQAFKIGDIIKAGGKKGVVKTVGKDKISVYHGSKGDENDLLKNHVHYAPAEVEKINESQIDESNLPGPSVDHPLVGKKVKFAPPSLGPLRSPYTGSG